MAWRTCYIRLGANIPSEPLVVRRATAALRIWILTAAFLQAVLPGVVSVVDASAAADAAWAAVQPHVESQGTHKGARVHQEDRCALCQFVSGALAPSAEAAPISLQQSNTLRVIGTRPQSPNWLTDGDPSLPRAPPKVA
jgi:hypothetical protein